MFKSPPPYLARDGLVDLRKKHPANTHKIWKKPLQQTLFWIKFDHGSIGLENNSCQDYIADEIPDDFIMMLCSTKYENTK